jgi:IS30 family transposase
MVYRPLRAEQCVFWDGYASGVTIEAASERVGHSLGWGRRLVHKAGGVRPDFTRSRVPSSRLLSIAEREQILAGMERGDSIRQIARDLGRAPSTVQREIRRNVRSKQNYRSRAVYEKKRASGRPRIRPLRYSPHVAQLRADHLASRARAGKLATSERLRRWVQDRLEEEHSPEQIAAMLPIEFPHDLEMRVSHETIYQALYVQGRGGLRRDLHQRLRTGRALRKPNRQATRRRQRIPGMVLISERPAEVEDRAVPGHWEGDLIMGGAGTKSAIGTLVERTSRYVMLLHLPDGFGADAVQSAMVEAMSRLPDELRQTLTWDQGFEMANHVQIAAATDLDIYFCDPHSPWQRGSNENTNGLLRQYFPKGADLNNFPADYLAHVARKLNTRPRKTLGWKTPAQVLDELLSNPNPPPSVAMTG